MTPNQKKVYNYILAYHEKKGECPSTRTIAAHFGVSHQTTHGTCKRLVEKGYLQIRPIESYYELSPFVR